VKTYFIVYGITGLDIPMNILGGKKTTKYRIPLILFQDFVLCTLMSQSAENSMFLIKGSSLNIS